jgi:hypothetical protein
MNFPCWNLWKVERFDRFNAITIIDEMLEFTLAVVRTDNILPIAAIPDVKDHLVGGIPARELGNAARGDQREQQRNRVNKSIKSINKVQSPP